MFAERNGDMPDNAVPWLVSILVSLVFGFLIGWLLEYYLDLKYWEMRAKRRGLVITGEEGKALLAACASSWTNANKKSPSYGVK
jgi:hypothetical protein